MKAEKSRKLRLKRYINDRNEMLLKCNVNELRNFIRSNKAVYDAELYEHMMAASDNQLEVVLHKMIVNVVTLPKGFRAKSEKWLNDHNYSSEV